MVTTLIQPFEVVKISPVKGKTDAAQFCNNISRVEEKLFDDCIGSDMYADMIASLTPAPGTFTLYEQGIAYSAGDWVQFESEFYECILLTDGTQSPCDSDYFTKQDKFTTAPYNALWERYLAKILANSVVVGVLPYMAIQIAESGVIRQTSDRGTFQPAEGKEMATVKIQLTADIADDLRLMHKYIIANESSYPLYKYIIENNCRPCGDDGCGASKKDWSNGFNVF